MKRIGLVLLIVMVVSGSAFGATLNLTAIWTANTEADMKEYRIVRTDGTRTQIAAIAHPTTTWNFSVDVANWSAGTLTFVLVAVDTNGNVSADSATASYSYNLDRTPPVAPRNLWFSRH